PRQAERARWALRGGGRIADAAASARTQGLDRRRVRQTQGLSGRGAPGRARGQPALAHRDRRGRKAADPHAARRGRAARGAERQELRGAKEGRGARGSIVNRLVDYRFSTIWLTIDRD